MRRLIELTNDQAEEIDERLEDFNEKHIGYSLEGTVKLGIEEDGEIVAGILGYMTVYKILYVETLIVDEEYRRKGLGRELITEMEKQAKKLGATVIRLDTFDWQGYEFYKAMGYEEVGHYSVEEDNFREYFFIKKI